MGSDGIATVTWAETNIHYFARSATHMYDEKRVLAARTVQGFFLVVAAQKKAAQRATARLVESRQKSVWMAAMNRAATEIHHFSRLMTHMHDERRALAA